MKLLSVRPSRPTMSVSALLLIRSCVLIGRAVQQECRDRKSGSAGMPRSEERFSRNAETDLVCRLLLEKKKRKVNGSYHNDNIRSVNIKRAVADIETESEHQTELN